MDNKTTVFSRADTATGPGRTRSGPFVTSAIHDDRRDQDTDEALARATADLDGVRDQLTRSIAALEEELAREFDWRRWVQRRPGLMLGLAFGAGFFLGRQ